MTEESLTARNRINQRNFRARRQNYIKELEERIRKYESDGVQATIEVQAAARQVTDQNIRLRLLLTQRFGMSDQEISGYLGVLQHPLPNVPISCHHADSDAMPKLSPSNIPQQYDSSYSRPCAHLDSALGLASLRTYSPTHSNQSWSQQPSIVTESSGDPRNRDIDMKASMLDTDISSSPTDSLLESSNPSTPTEHTRGDHSTPVQAKCGPTTISGCGSRAVPCTTSSADSSLTTLIRPNDERTCEEAARIIASMRGNAGSTDEVMWELGCTKGDKKCSVKNVKVFQLMDRG